MTAIIRLSDHRHRKGRVYFNRTELSQLLGLYSERVAAGEWRDYAIDHAVGAAVFSVFRHTHDRPLYAIAKLQGPRGVEYSVHDAKGRRRRSQTLAEALAHFDRRLRLVTD